MSIDQASRQLHYKTASWVLVAIILGLVSWLNTIHLRTNDDVSLLLTTASRVWDGEKLYRDIIEVNLPLSVWLYMPNMALEKLAGIRSEWSLNISMFLLALGSILFSARMLRKYVSGYEKPVAWLLVPATLFLALCFAPTQFGQREEFALLFLLPWLAQFSARDSRQDFAAGNWASWLVAGLGGGLSMIIKPPFFALPLAIPIAVAVLRRRNIRIAFTAENIIAASIVIIYSFYILEINPYYMKNVFPLVINIYGKTSKIINEQILIAIFTEILALIALLLLTGSLLKLNAVSRNSMLASIGFSIAYVAMGKGWFQHAVPYFVLAITAIVAELVAGNRPFRIDRKTTRLREYIVASIAIYVPLSFFTLAVVSDHKFGYEPDLIKLVRQVKTPTIASISPRMIVSFPLVRMVDGKFVSKYATSWPVQYTEAMIRNASSDQKKKYYSILKENVISQYILELNSKRPDYIIAGKEKNSNRDALLSDKRIKEILKLYKLVYDENHDIDKVIFEIKLYERKDLISRN